MTRETLNKLEKIAQKLGNNVFKIYVNPNGGHNDFHDFKYDGSKKLREELKDNGAVRFHFNQHANIEFKNIRPNKVNDIIYGTPSLRNTKTEEVDTVTVNNNTSKDMMKTHTFNKQSEMKTETNIEVAVKIAISQEITAGSGLYGIESKTSISSELATTIQNNMAKTNTTSTGDTLEVTVPAKSRIDLVSMRSVSDFEQIITANCDLDFDIRGESRDDYVVEYTSLKDLQDDLQGTAYQEGNSKFKQQVFGKRDMLDLRELLGDDLNTDLETIIKFSNATTGDINANQYEIKAL